MSQSASTPVATIEETLAVVQALEGVTDIVAGSGQVLIHRNHVPLGFYVVVDGTLILSDGHGVEFLRASASSGPILVPAVGELEVAAARSARVEVGAHVLYLPRSLALFNPDIRSLLSGLELRAVSLQSTILSGTSAQSAASPTTVPGSLVSLHPVAASTATVDSNGAKQP